MVRFSKPSFLKSGSYNVASASNNSKSGKKNNADFNDVCAKDKKKVTSPRDALAKGKAYLKGVFGRSSASYSLVGNKDQTMGSVSSEQEERSNVFSTDDTSSKGTSKVSKETSKVFSSSDDPLNDLESLESYVSFEGDDLYEGIDDLYEGIDDLYEEIDDFSISFSSSVSCETDDSSQEIDFFSTSSVPKMHRSTTRTVSLLAEKSKSSSHLNVLKDAASKISGKVKNVFSRNKGKDLGILEKVSIGDGPPVLRLYNADGTVSEVFPLSSTVRE